MKKMIYLVMAIGFMGSAIMGSEQGEPDKDFEEEVLKPLDRIVKKIAQQNLDIATDAKKHRKYEGFLIIDRWGQDVPTNSVEGSGVMHDMIALAYLMENHPREFALGNFNPFSYNNPWVEVDKTEWRLKELNQEKTPENIAAAAALNSTFLYDDIKASGKRYINPENNKIQRAFNILYSAYAEKHPDKIAQKGYEDFISDQKTGASNALFKENFANVLNKDLRYDDLSDKSWEYINNFDCRFALERLKNILPQEELEEINTLTDRIMQGKPAPKIVKESIRPFFSALEVEKPSIFQSFINSVKDWFAQTKESFKSTNWQQKLQSATESAQQSMRQVGQKTSASLKKTAERIAAPSQEAQSSFGSTIEGEGSGKIQRYEIVPGSPIDKARQWWKVKKQ